MATTAAGIQGGAVAMPGLLALTFDNLGEAADVERGLWPPDRPPGRHPSVTEALPRLLATLDDLGLRATFCVEAINAEHHPAALRAIADRGHELAVHGWRHERWGDLDAACQSALLERSRAAFAAIGLAPAGFRPPGGALGPAGARVLAAHGFTWASAARSAGGEDAHVPPPASVPFAWPLVDAYHALGHFGDLRVRLGDPAAPLAADQRARRLSAELDAAAACGGTHVLVLHPFLAVGDDGAAATRRVLEHVRALHDRGVLRASPVQDVI